MSIAQVNIYFLLILLFLSTRTVIASPLRQPVDNSASLYDFPNFQSALDPVSKQPVETDDVFNNYPHGLVEQPQAPPIMPGIISTSSEDTATTTTGGPPQIPDSWQLGAVQFQPSSPSSTFNTAGGSRFELAEALPTRLPREKLGPAAPVTSVETVYLCCESKGENKYVCDDRQQNERLVRDYCSHTLYECPKDRLITSLAMECQDKSVERGVRQSGMAVLIGGTIAILKCIVTGGLHDGPLACIGLPSIPDY